MDDPNEIEMTDELLRWRARDVNFIRGPWSKLRATIPEYELGAFSVGVDGPTNPYLRSVIRLPVNPTEHPIPIATVSPTYALAPHNAVADMCIEGLHACGVEVKSLKFELGLSALGEWMNLRILLPDEYSLTDTHGHKTGLRLECFNSVDGSSRLVILFGWIRFICSNGLIIGETMIEIRERHDGSLDLGQIPDRISLSFKQADGDRNRRLAMQKRKVDRAALKLWVNGALSAAWGKKAAARVHHICETGHDVDFADPFAKGLATEKPVILLQAVPGSPELASTIYDVMQAMSFVAGSKKDALGQQDMLQGLDKLLVALDRAA